MTEPGSPATEPAGRSVLVARAPERAAGLVALLRERGLEPVAAPVIERAPVEDLTELDAARERLAAGAYAWVAITSVNAVDALLGTAPTDGLTAQKDTTSQSSVALRRQRPLGATDLPVPSFFSSDTPHVRWAAVGPATERALTAHGIDVDLVPETATAVGLVAAFPAPPRAPERTGGTGPRVLLPLGDLASDTLRAGLTTMGWTVDTVTAYRTLAHELAPELRGRYDVVVVTSGSVARQVAAQLGPQRVVAIGEPSARVAHDVGHTVLAVAEHPTDRALADAVTEALVRT